VNDKTFGDSSDFRRSRVFLFEFDRGIRRKNLHPLVSADELMGLTVIDDTRKVTEL
jgi:hypothetical protein